MSTFLITTMRATCPACLRPLV